MKTKKVLAVRCHIGAGIQGRLNYSEKSADGRLELDGYMELVPMGVFIAKHDLLIPFTNITSATMAKEDEAKK